MVTVTAITANAPKACGPTLRAVYGDGSVSSVESPTWNSCRAINKVICPNFFVAPQTRACKQASCVRPCSLARPPRHPNMSDRVAGCTAALTGGGGGGGGGPEHESLLGGGPQARWS